MKLIKNQNGFSPFHILLLILLLILLGFVGWRVYDQNKSDKSSTDNNQAETSTPSAAVEYVTLTNTDAKFSIEHPKTWTATTDNTGQSPGNGGIVYSGKTTITAPSGKKLEVIYHPQGIGGNCDVGENDVAFADGNPCPSFENTLVSETPLDAGTMAKLGGGSKPVYLLHHRTKKASDAVVYVVCLSGPGYNYDTETNGVPELNMPRTGFYFACGHLADNTAGYMYRVEMKDTAADANAFFNDADVKEAEKALKTFQIL